jgi:hypothetical protein
MQRLKRNKSMFNILVLGSQSFSKYAVVKITVLYCKIYFRPLKFCTDLPNTVMYVKSLIKTQ